MIALANRPLTRKNLLYLFLLAFILRAATFIFFIQHEERYRQPDTMDYHNSAIGISVGSGMHRADTMEPIFWRTPGYPYYLSKFYDLFGIRTPRFGGNTPAHMAAIWVQIFLSSLIPAVIALLALWLADSLTIAWLAGIIVAVHHAFVLASTYLLTEGLGLLFFCLFLLFFYRSFDRQSGWSKQIIWAALNLGIFTWIRPMGEFVTIVTMLTLLLFSTTSWKIRLKKIALFTLTIIAVISPWYIRNHALTGHWFFCPMFGPYLNSFIAPKIVRDVRAYTLEDSIRALYKLGVQETEQMRMLTAPSRKFYPKEFGCLRIALPIVQQYPLIAAHHWMKEVCKTAFDLYASQLVAIANNTFMWDPLEEFLGEKLALALYKQPMPCWMRIIAWLELLFLALQWIGIIAGSFCFVLLPWLQRKPLARVEKNLQHLFLITMPLICGTMLMTGGFGYARLRLPVEPLMIILALSFWFWWWKIRKGA